MSILAEKLQIFPIFVNYKLQRHFKQGVRHSRDQEKFCPPPQKKNTIRVKKQLSSLSLFVIYSLQSLYVDFMSIFFSFLFFTFLYKFWFCDRLFFYLSLRLFLYLSIASLLWTVCPFLSLIFTLVQPRRSHCCRGWRWAPSPTQRSSPPTSSCPTSPLCQRHPT